MGKLHGVDLDPDIHSNDAIETSEFITNDSYPFADCTFDACASNYVLEHISDPQRHISEVARVLKSGGVYLFRTPNCFHYTALLARFTHLTFHKLVANYLHNIPSGSHDPYPTVYKLNSRRAIGHNAKNSTFTVEKPRFIEKEPSYGMSSRVLFLAFVAYEFRMNSFLLSAATFWGY